MLVQIFITFSDSFLYVLIEMASNNIFIYEYEQLLSTGMEVYVWKYLLQLAHFYYWMDFEEISWNLPWELTDNC